MLRSLQIVFLSCVLGTNLATAQPPPLDRPAATLATVQDELDRQLREMKRLRDEQVQLKDLKDSERVQKQLDLLQKQIQTLQNMAQLLAEQIKKQAPSAEAVDKLQTESARLESHARQAARRDRELAQATDDLREQLDSRERTGPLLPATLKELYLPTRTNESPLAIYGTLAADFQDFQDQPSNFPSPVLSPHFYLLLNEQFLLEANPEFRGTSVSLDSAQLDWFLHDNLTLVVGRFYSPLGFFTERLHTSWIFKTPDRPLMFQQVYPSPLSMNGLQARGALELCDWPVKLEYASVVTNGFSLAAARPTAKDFADLRAMKDAFDDVNNPKAFGGRLGLSLPPVGIIVGISGLANGSYDRARNEELNLWDVDASWHYGNWDVRFEYARVNQQAPTGPIRRQGLYAQVAYRPYDCANWVLQKTEAVFRFDHVEFDGINLTATGLDFGSRDRIPIDRNRYSMGLNYYPYPSLVVKAAYEISDELRSLDLKDNAFLAQLAWGF